MTTYLAFSVAWVGLPFGNRFRYQASKGTFEQISGVPSVSAWVETALTVSGVDDAQVRSVMQRSRAWGVTTVWIGSGERPKPGMADHVLWLDDPDPRVPATGGFVLFYHLLWELTHVCF